MASLLRNVSRHDLGGYSVRIKGVQTAVNSLKEKGKFTRGSVQELSNWIPNANFTFWLFESESSCS